MKENNDLVPKIVWGGLVSSLFLYGAVLIITGKVQVVALPTSLVRPLEMIALITPMILVVNLLLLKLRLAKATNGQQAFTCYVTSWAINETIAIFGFIATFTSPEGNGYFAMVNIFAALVGDFLMFPKTFENKR